MHNIIRCFCLTSTVSVFGKSNFSHVYLHESKPKSRNAIQTCIVLIFVVLFIVQNSICKITIINFYLWYGKNFYFLCFSNNESYLLFTLSLINKVLQQASLFSLSPHYNHSLHQYDHCALYVSQKMNDSKIPNFHPTVYS